METITFTSAVLKSFTRDHKRAKAHFSASFSQAVSRSMGWCDPHESHTGEALDGELAAQSMILTPNDGPLSKNEISVDISKVYAFQAVRREIEGKKGKGYRFELHFETQFADTNGCALLEEYITTVGDGKGKLRIAYTKQPKQMDIDGIQASEEQRSAQREIEVQ